MLTYLNAVPNQQPDRELIRIPSITGDPDDYYHFLPPVGMKTHVAVATANTIILRRGAELQRNCDAGLGLEGYCDDGREIIDGVLAELAALGFEQPMYGEMETYELKEYSDAEVASLGKAYVPDAVSSPGLAFDAARRISMGIDWKDVCEKFNLDRERFEQYAPQVQNKYIADYLRCRRDDELKNGPGAAP